MFVLRLRSVQAAGAGEEAARGAQDDVADGERPVPPVSASHDDGHAQNGICSVS